MLVLTRNAGQVINIGNDIKLIILEIADDQIRIGIDAPRDVNIRRGEIPECFRQQSLSGG